MHAPLPRVWDHVEGGLCEPVRATISHGHAHTVGGDVSLAALQEARETLMFKVRKDIKKPLWEWEQALQIVEVRRNWFRGFREVGVVGRGVSMG